MGPLRFTLIGCLAAVAASCSTPLEPPAYVRVTPSVTPEPPTRAPLEPTATFRPRDTLRPAPAPTAVATPLSAEDQGAGGDFETWIPCLDAPPSRLHVGDLAYVSMDSPYANLVRDEPDQETGDPRGQLNPGEGIEVLDGPVCGNSFVWWHVDSMATGSGLAGWTVEGDAASAWLVPLPPDNALIVYELTTAQGRQVFSIQADGREDEWLTDYRFENIQPAWSPDGGQIVYASDQGGDQSSSSPKDNFEIYVMKADGSSPLRLTNDSGEDSYPSWSPDGASIAFVSDRTGNSDIWSMDASGGELQRLTDNPAEERQPTWSPDGRKIAFVRERAEDNEPQIFVMNADGTDQIQLTAVSGGVESPAWSPDGRRIAFALARTGNEVGRDICLMNADGSQIIRLTQSPNVSGAPAWSADGARIAYVMSYTDLQLTRGFIMIMNADGSGARPLPKSDSGFIGRISWRP